MHGSEGGESGSTGLPYPYPRSPAKPSANPKQRGLTHLLPSQGGLVIPKEGTEFVIRFRVALPDHADEITRDMKVKISH
jgi:hypothetical protein